MAANNKGFDEKGNYTPVGAKTSSTAVKDNGWDASTKTYTTVASKQAKVDAYNQAFDRLSKKPFEGDTEEAAKAQNKMQNTKSLIDALQRFPAASTPFENAAQPFNPTLPNVIPGYGNQPMDKQDIPERYPGTSSYGTQPLDKQDYVPENPYYGNAKLEAAPNNLTATPAGTPAAQPSFWDKTKGVLSNVTNFLNPSLKDVAQSIQGPVNDKITAGASELAGGVAHSLGLDYALDKSMGIPDGSNERIHQQNLKQIPEGLANALNVTGQVGGAALGGEALAPARLLEGLNFLNTTRTAAGALKATLPAVESLTANAARTALNTGTTYGLGQAFGGATEPRNANGAINEEATKAKVQENQKNAALQSTNLKAEEDQIKGISEALTTNKAKIDQLQTNIQNIQKTYPNGEGMPESVQADYQKNIDSYNNLINQHSADINSFNQLIESHSKKVDQFNQQISADNDFAKKGITYTGQKDRNLAEIFGADFRRGMGDINITAGDIAKWRGYNQLGTDLINSGTDMQKGFDTNVQYKGWESFLDPKFLASAMGRNLPSTLSLMPLGLAGGAAGGAIAGAAKFGPFGRTVMQALGAGALSAPMEAAMEAGQTYDQMRTEKKSPEEAKKAADRVFLQNTALLTGTNSAEFGNLFMPKGVHKVLGSLPGKLASSAVMEGGEEGVQQWIQNAAQGKPTSLADKDMQQAIGIGALMGVGFGIAGHAAAQPTIEKTEQTIQNIRDRVFASLPDEDKTDMDGWIKDKIKQGVSPADAQAQALDMISTVPEGQALVQNAVDEVVQSENNHLIAGQDTTDVVNHITGSGEQAPVAPAAETPAATATPAQETAAAAATPAETPVTQQAPPQETPTAPATTTPRAPANTGAIDFSKGAQVTLKGRKGKTFTIVNAGKVKVELQHPNGGTFHVDRRAIYGNVAPEAPGAAAPVTAPEAQEAPAETPVAASDAPKALAFNNDRIELKLATKPNDETIAKLEKAGFEHKSRADIWVTNKNNEANWITASEIHGSFKPFWEHAVAGQERRLEELKALNNDVADIEIKDHIKRLEKTKEILANRPETDPRSLKQNPVASEESIARGKERHETGEYHRAVNKGIENFTPTHTYNGVPVETKEFPLNGLMMFRYQKMQNDLSTGKAGGEIKLNDAEGMKKLRPIDEVISEEEQAQFKAVKEFNQMRDHLAVNGATWGAKYLAKHLEKMRDLAEQHGLTFSERYVNMLEKAHNDSQITAEEPKEAAKKTQSKAKMTNQAIRSVEHSYHFWSKSWTDEKIAERIASDNNLDVADVLAYARQYRAEHGIPDPSKTEEMKAWNDKYRAEFNRKKLEELRAMSNDDLWTEYFKVERFSTRVQGTTKQEITAWFKNTAGIWGGRTFGDYGSSEHSGPKGWSLKLDDGRILKKTHAQMADYYMKEIADGKAPAKDEQESKFKVGDFVRYEVSQGREPAFYEYGTIVHSSTDGKHKIEYPYKTSADKKRTTDYVWSQSDQYVEDYNFIPVDQRHALAYKEYKGQQGREEEYAKEIAERNAKREKIIQDAKAASSTEEPKEVQQKFENLHYSLSPNDDEIAAIRKAQPPNVLVSYGTWNEERQRKMVKQGKQSKVWSITDFAKEIQTDDYKPNIILDSGAYSFYNKGETVNADEIKNMYGNDWTEIFDMYRTEYDPEADVRSILNQLRYDLYHTQPEEDMDDVEFDEFDDDHIEETEHIPGPSENNIEKFLSYIDMIEENKASIDYVMNMDTIGDQEASDFAHSVMEELGVKPMPVFTYGSDMATLDKYVKGGADYIALGGTAVLKGDGKKQKIVDWVNEITNEYPDVKFHLLGTNDIKQIISKTPGLYSADGTTWQSASMIGKKGVDARSDAGAAEIQKREQQVADLKRTEYNIFRQGTSDENLIPSTKPHGLYFSLVDDVNTFKTPHTDAGEVGYSGKAYPKNSLVADEIKVTHTRFKEWKSGVASAGVAALDKLVPKDEFNQLLKMSKKELIQLLDEKFPGPDYNKYHDSYELLEAYAGQLAREQGYDSIILRDKEHSDLHEIVILDDNVMKLDKPKGQAQRDTKADQVRQNIQDARDGIKEIDEQLAELEQEYQQEIDNEYNFLKKSMNERDGVDQGSLVLDEEGQVIDRIGRKSKNPDWYRKFFKEYGHAPTNKLLKVLAKEHVDNGFIDSGIEIPSWTEENSYNEKKEALNNAKNEIIQSITELTNTLPAPKNKARDMTLPPETEAPVNVLNDHHARMKARADAARQRIKTKYGAGGNTLSSGLPPDLLVDLSIIGYTKILDGVSDLKSWTEAMMQEASTIISNSERIRKWLPSVYAMSEQLAEAHDPDAMIDDILTDAFGETFSDNIPKEGKTDGIQRSERKETANNRRNEGTADETASDNGRHELPPKDSTSPVDSRHGDGTKPRPDMGERADETVHGQRQSQLAGRNHLITTELDSFGGAKTKFKSNMAAIETLLAVTKENRQATPDEQAILAKYVGWGALQSAFDSKNKDWAKEYEQLRALVTDGHMSESAYQDAISTVQYAHYTSKDIISAMYDVMKQFGFHGGRILEPGVGIGNFFGLMPGEISAHSELTGIEKDELSGRIAKLLYPNANIQIKPFQDYIIPDGYFDIAIGNPPFSDITLPYGPKGKGSKKLLLHNYFFIQSLDKVRDGGIVAFVTSSGTMNAKSSADQRRMMMDRADFLGAIRLPNNAFQKNAGTSVTTDVIFFQKRAEGQESHHQYGFATTKKIKVTDDGETRSMDINEYYDAHPNQVLGVNVFDGRYPDRLAVKSDGRDLAEALQGAIKALPSDIYTDPVTRIEKEKVFDQYDYSTNINELDEGGYGSEGGKIVQRKGDKLIPVTFKDAKTADRVRGMIPIRNAGRNILHLQLDNATDEQLKAAQVKLGFLYDNYVKRWGYLNDVGNVRAMKGDSIGTGFLMSLEMKDKNKDKNAPITYSKEAIFTQRTITKNQAVTKVETAEDALSVSLFETGRLNFERMSALTGKTEEQLIADLDGKIYQNPDNGQWETADEYLSGNVRQKLVIAENAAELNSKYNQHVEVLKSVIPPDLETHEIGARLGSPWIPTEDVEKFIEEFLHTQPGQVSVYYEPFLSSWSVQEIFENYDAIDSVARNTRNTEEYGVVVPHGKNKTALHLIEDSLNLRQTMVMESVDGKSVPNSVLSSAAQAKQKQIERLFRAWLFDDNERGPRLSTKYNNEYNNSVERKFDGELIYGNEDSKTTLPGSTIILRNHQRNFVWRAVQGLNALAAHVVGSGKTYSLIHAAMEMKRLGLINKPAFVVPNHLLHQWQADFRKSYPGSKVLRLSNDDIPSLGVKRNQVHVIDPITMKDAIVKDSLGFPVLTADGRPEKLMRDMTDEEYQDKRDIRRAERAAALSKIAVGSYDAVLITHKTFEKLPMSPQAIQDHIQEQIDDVIMAIQGSDDAVTVKKLQAMKSKLEQQLKNDLSEDSKDVAIPFEELGIDQLFVDESHMFKNLRFHTKMRNVSSLPQTHSQRAQDMYIKSQYLTKLRGGRGVVFATGTPITNAVAELYTLMRYLMLDKMRALGIAHFDAWAATFGELTNDYEVTATGQYKQKTRFARYMNVQQLMQLFRQFADIKTADMLKLPVPGNVISENIVVPMSAEQTAYRAEIYRRAQRMSSVDKRDDNYLKLTGDARKMSLDIRLVDKTVKHDDEFSKINTAINKMADIYFDPDIAKDADGRKVENHTQLVFLDLGTPKKTDEAEDEAETKKASKSPEAIAAAALQAEEDAEAASIYQNVKDGLIKRGIPAHEIAFIHDANTDIRKAALMEKVRDGDVRFLIGSTEKMGAGMNVQERLVAIHHIDAPWRPADLEQRNGRMVRQYNLNDTVYIYNYTTKGSFDTVMWETLRRKAFMITQLMNGSSKANTLEEIEQFVMNFAIVAAETSDNPLMGQLLEANREVLDLEAQKFDHESSVGRMRKEMISIPKEIKSHEKYIKDIKKDAERANAVPIAKRVLVADGVTYTLPDEAQEKKWDAEIKKQVAAARAKLAPNVKLSAEAISEIEKAVVGPNMKETAGEKLIEMYNRVMSDAAQGDSIKVGTFAGFDLNVKKGAYEPFRLVGVSDVYSFDVNTFSAMGSYTRMINAFDHVLEGSSDYSEKQIVILTNRLKDIIPLAEKKFGAENELIAAQAKYSEIQAQLIALNDAHDQTQVSDEDETGDEDVAGEYFLPAATQTQPPKKTRKVKPANPIQRIIEETKKVLTPKATQEIADLIAKTLKTVVYEGYVKRKAQGTYFPKSKVAAVKGASYSEWRVVGHELGHAFSDYFSRAGDLLSTSFHKKELRAMANKLYPDPKAIKNMPVKDQVEEGFAEFFRQWVADPETAEKNAPVTFAQFTAFIENNPELIPVMAQVRGMVDDDLSGDVFERAANGIISTGAALDEKFGDNWDLGILRPVFNTTDYTLPAKAMMDRLRNMGLKVKADLAQLLSVNGNGQAKALVNFTSQATDTKGNFIKGRPIQKIAQEAIDIIGNDIGWKKVTLKSVKKDYLLYKKFNKMNAANMFDAILLALRLEERYSEGYDKAPMTLEMAQEILAITEKRWPQVWDSTKKIGKRGLAEETVDTFGYVVLEKMQRSGLITAQTRQNVEERSHLYVPMIEDKEAARKMASKKGSYRTTKSPLYHYKGKETPVLGALDAMLIKYVEVETAIEHKQAFDALHDALSQEKMGIFGRVDVPSPVKANIINTEQVFAKMEDAAIKILEDNGILNNVFKDNSLTFFTPAGLSKIDPDDPVIMNMRGGVPVYIQLHPDVYKMMLAMQPVAVTGVMKLAVQLNRYTRYAMLGTGIYTLSAAARDAGTLAFQSKAPLNTMTINMGKAVWAIFGKGKHGEATYDRFLTSGAYNSAAENLITSQLQHISTESLIRTTAPGWYHVSLKDGAKKLIHMVDPFHVAHKVIKFNEELPRIAEFISVMKMGISDAVQDGLKDENGADIPFTDANGQLLPPKELWDLNRTKDGKVVSVNELWDIFRSQGTEFLPKPLRKEMGRIITAAGYAAAESTTNFLLHGADENARKYIPTVSFLHGTQQGFYRMARQVGTHPVRTLVVTQAGMAFLSVLSWLLMSANDDDKKFMQDMDSTARDRYWWFPVFGTHIAIAKPFEYAIPVNMLERFLDHASGDPQSRGAFSDMRTLFSGITGVNVLNGTVQSIIDMARNKSSYGGAIIPQSEDGKAPYLKFGPESSLTAQSVARLFVDISHNEKTGFSPRMYDYFLKQNFGKVATSFLSATDFAIKFAQTGSISKAYQTGYRPTTGIEYAPIIGQVLRSSAEGGSRIVEDFYNQYNDTKLMSGTSDSLMKTVRDRFAKDKDKMVLPSVPANMLKSENIQKLQFLPAMDWLATEMSKTRKQFAQEIADAPNADVRRTLTIQKDYIEKLAAGVLFGYTPSPPNADSHVTPQDIEQLKSYYAHGAQQAMIREQNKKGGVTDQVIYLTNMAQKNVVK